MRIIMVIERYIPIWGGSENQLRQLSPHLTKAGYQVEVVTRRWHQNMLSWDIVDDVIVRRLGKPGEGRIATLYFVVVLFWHLLRKAGKNCIIHTHGAAALGAVGVLAARMRGAAVVAKIATAGRIPLLCRNAAGRLVLSLFKRADKIVSMTNEIKEELTAIGTCTDQIVRIPNGVDGQRFRPSTVSERDVWRKARGMADEVPIVVFSGRFVPRKGLDLLLEAWPRVVGQEPSAQLIVLGSGADQPDSIEKRMRRVVSEKGLANVSFEGECKEPETYLAIADIFAFPSRKEGFPNALLEAMASGLAVVARRIGGVSELIEDQLTGLLCAPNDTVGLSQALLQLTMDRKFRDRLGKQAREQVLKNYKFEQVAKKYERVYNELVSGT